MKEKITFFYRKQRITGNFSIENYFNEIIPHIKEKYEVKIVKMPFYSNGFIPRLFNILYTYYYQGEINHITGDINYIAIALNNNNSILTIHDLNLIKNSSFFKTKLYKYFWYRVPIKKSFFVTTVSEVTKNDLQFYLNLNHNKFYVIPVCISNSFYKLDKPFNYAKPQILQVGTASNKNLKNLILAIIGLNVELVIIGKLTRFYLDLIKINNISFRLLDYPLTEIEIINEYNKADIISLISTSEGFGMPILEGNAIGRVVITSNVSSMPFVAGDAALLVNPLSINEINNGLKLLISDEKIRNKFINNGYNNIKRFNSKEIAEKYLILYNQIKKSVNHV